MNKELLVLFFFLLFVLVDFEHHLLEGRERSGHSSSGSGGGSGGEGWDEASGGGRGWSEEVEGWEDLLLVEVWVGSVEFGWRSMGRVAVVKEETRVVCCRRRSSGSLRESWSGGSEGLA